MTSVKNKVFILTQKLYRQWLGISDGRKVALNLMNRIHFPPFGNLSFVFDNFRVEFFVHPIERYTPICINNKLLFQPQFFLKILNLCEKVNNNLTDTLDCLHLGKIAISALLIGSINIIKMNDFALYKKSSSRVKKAALNPYV